MLTNQNKQEKLPTNLVEVADKISSHLAMFFIFNDNWTHLADDLAFEEENNKHVFTFEFNKEALFKELNKVINQYLKKSEPLTKDQKKVIKDIMSAIKKAVLNFDFYYYSYPEFMDQEFLLHIEDRELMAHINDAIMDVVNTKPVWA